MDKCRLLQSHVEFVGRDLTSDGNCPAQSNFLLMCDWGVIKSGQILHSFIGLVLFCSKYAPHLEMRIKPLRRLLKAYFREPIPTMTWSPNLMLLYQDIKDQITSSPIFAWYDPAKPTFLKTDWSAEGMGWILI